MAVAQRGAVGGHAHVGGALPVHRALRHAHDAAIGGELPAMVAAGEPAGGVEALGQPGLRWQQRSSMAAGWPSPSSHRTRSWPSRRKGFGPSASRRKRDDGIPEAAQQRGLGRAHRGLLRQAYGLRKAAQARGKGADGAGSGASEPRRGSRGCRFGGQAARALGRSASPAQRRAGAVKAPRLPSAPARYQPISVPRPRGTARWHALPTRFWQDLPWPAFRDLPANTVAVLPVASIEQHGPHLPVSVDTTINQGVIARTLAVHARRSCRCWCCRRSAVAQLGRAPALSRHADDHAGDAAGLVADIGASPSRGPACKRLVICNSHGGNVVGARHRCAAHPHPVRTSSWSTRCGRAWASQRRCATRWRAPTASMPAATRRR